MCDTSYGCGVVLSLIRHVASTSLQIKVILGSAVDILSLCGSRYSISVWLDVHIYSGLRFRSKICVFCNGIHTEYFVYLQCKSGNMNIITEYAVFERNRNPLYNYSCKGM